MLELLMFGQVEARHLLGASECHAHLTFILVLVPVLLLHLADLGVLTALDLTLSDCLIVVFFVFLAAFAFFATLTIVAFLIPVVRLLTAL